MFVKSIYRYASFLILILVFASLLFAQKLTVRNAHSMIYDSKNKQVLLFGGADEKQVYGDLWKLNNSGWELVKTSKSPEPRTFASLVYDEDEQRIVLFGGNKVLFGNKKNPAKMFGDTWEFKGGNWRKLEISESPEPRAEAAIAYDSLEKRIILFGGYKLVNGKVRKLNDTWELKGDKWERLNDSFISPRNGAALSFDKKLKKVVLFGGSTPDKEYGEKTGETWVLEGGAWRNLKIEQPANIFNSNMVFDEKSKQTFRFGGWNGTERINETWIFKDQAWTKLNLKTNPPARNHSAMVYDSNLKQVILFGGHDGEKIFGDLWVFKKGNWSKKFENPSVKRITNGH